MTKCRLKVPETTDCWRYEPGASIPVWVARKCHDLGDGKLTVYGVTGVETAAPGDVILDVGIGVLLVPKAEFDADYEVIDE